MKSANDVEAQNLSSSSPLYHLLESLSSASTQSGDHSLTRHWFYFQLSALKKFQHVGGKENHDLKNSLK
jgi:hypothetical protein